MARRRRTRIPTGFGQGGRTALITSLLPTASEKAASDSAQRAADNAKVAAFNSETISFPELQAYFQERLAAATDPTLKTELQSTIDNAKAADNKRKDNTAATAANQAIKDFTTGNTSYDDAISQIQANADRATSPEIRTQINRLKDDAAIVNTQRIVNQKVDDYNKSRINYSELRTALSSQQTGTKNDLIKQQIATAMDGARSAENRKVIAQTQGDLNAGNIDLNTYVTTLTNLRNQSDQRDPNSLQEIGAAIISGEQQEQSVQDSKTYTAWQEGQITAAQALTYYNGRIATARDPKTVEALGKYAANLQQAIVENNGLAFGQGSSVRAASASRAATAAIIKQATDDANAHIADYKANEFKNYLDQAKKTGDPKLVMLAWEGLGQALQEGASLGGSNARALMDQAGNVTKNGYLMASSIVYDHFFTQKDEIEKAAGKDPVAQIEAANKIVDLSVKAETGGWLDTASQIDPRFASQVTDIVDARREVGKNMLLVAQTAKDAWNKSQIESGAPLDTTAKSFLAAVASGNKSAIALLGDIAPQNVNALALGAKPQVNEKQVLDWIQSGNTTERLNAILTVTNLGVTPGTAGPEGDLVIAAATTKMLEALNSTNISKDTFVKAALAAGNAAAPGHTVPMSELSQQVDRGEVPNPIDPYLLNASDPAGPQPMVIDAQGRENRTTAPGTKIRDVAPSAAFSSPLELAQGRLGNTASFLGDVAGGFKDFLGGTLGNVGSALDQARATGDYASIFSGLAPVNPNRQAAVQDILNRASTPGYHVNVPDQQQSSLTQSVPDIWSLVQPQSTPVYNPPTSQLDPGFTQVNAGPPPLPSHWQGTGPDALNFNNPQIDPGLQDNPSPQVDWTKWDTGYAGDTTGITHGH